MRRDPADKWEWLAFLGLASIMVLLLVMIVLSIFVGMGCD